MKPLVSVIIPVYNQTKELRLVLDSIKRQTWKNLEVVIVDDGSKENFQFSITNFQKDFPLEYFRQENKGAPAARNKGFELSKGKYVIFWDADVIAKPEMIEKMYQALQKNSNASYAYSDFRFQISDLGFYKTMKGIKFSVEALKENNFIHSTSLIRRKDVIKWDESLNRFQDWDLWLTMLEQGKKGVWIDEFLFKIIAKGTMSEWLPSFVYKFPFKYLTGVRKKVKRYEEARKIVLNKHNLA